VAALTAALVPTITLSGGVTDKAVGISLSTDKLTATQTNDGWSYGFVRATAPATGKVQFELNVGALATDGLQQFSIAVEPGTVDLSQNATWPAVVSSGVSLDMYASGWEIHKDGAFVTSGADNIALGDTLTCAFDPVGQTVSFYFTHSGTTVQLGSTQSWTSASGNYFGAIGLRGQPQVGTVKFASGQVRALDSGYSYYDAGTGGGSSAITATASSTLNTFLSASAAKALVHGLGSGTLNAFSSTIAGAVRVKGAASPAPSAFTSSSAAKVRVKASSSVSPNAFISAAAAKALIEGLGSGTPNVFGTTSVAKVRIKAAASLTPGLFTTHATIGASAIRAAASMPLSTFVSASAAKALVEGVGSGTLNGFTAAGSAKTKVRAAGSPGLDAFTGAAHASVRIKASATVNYGTFTLTATLIRVSEYPAGPVNPARVAKIGNAMRIGRTAAGGRVGTVARRG
jgi:hypothetical protein